MDFFHQYVRKIAVHKNWEAEGGWALIEDSALIPMFVDAYVNVL